MYLHDSYEPGHLRCTLALAERGNHGDLMIGSPRCCKLRKLKAGLHEAREAR